MPGGEGPWLAGALLLLCLLDSALARPQIYIVNGTKSRLDGIYEHQEHGSKSYYTKMGAISTFRRHQFLYSRTSGTPQTWLLGLGNSGVEEARAFFRASGPGPEPPSSGWRSTSKDGQHIGVEQKDISVTGVRLIAATEQEMFDGEGADTEDGIVCKTPSEDPANDQWIKISNQGRDPRYCNKKRHCKTAIDEPEICQPHKLVVTGSQGGSDGTYERASHMGVNVYKQPDKNNFIFKTDGRWKISEGPPKQAVVLFESEKSDTLPTKGWTWTGAAGHKQGKTPSQMQDIRVKVVDPEFKEVQTAGYFVMIILVI